MKEDDRLILVGVISAAHGIKGDVLVKSFTVVTLPKKISWLLILWVKTLLQLN